MEPSNDDKMFAALAHASGCFAGPLGPVVIWVIKKDSSPFVGYHAIQAAVYHLVAMIGYVLFATITCGFGAMILPVFWLPALYWAWQAYQGSSQGYPGIAGVGRPPELP